MKRKYHYIATDGNGGSYSGVTDDEFEGVDSAYKHLVKVYHDVLSISALTVKLPITPPTFEEMKQYVKQNFNASEDYEPDDCCDCMEKLGKLFYKATLKLIFGEGV